MQALKVRMPVIDLLTTSASQSLSLNERLTSNDFPCAHSIANMDVRLGYLRENEQDLDDLLFHLRSLTAHDIEERRRQWVKQALPDEHSTKVVLRSRALKLKYAADAIQGVDNQVRLFRVVFVEEIDQYFQTTTSNQASFRDMLDKRSDGDERDKHLQSQNRSMTQQTDKF